MVAAVSLVCLGNLLVPVYGLGEEKEKITGTYSDLRPHKKTGDILGVEIRIVYAGKGYQGTIQIAEGWPSDLILIKKINV